MTSQAVADIRAMAEEGGLRHVHVLAWRDLTDVEAGGSELYVAKLIEQWAEAGVDVTLRTSYAQGQRPRAERDGYHVIRRAGRNMVFPMTILEEATRRHGPIDGMLEVWNGVPYLSPAWYGGPKVVLLHHLHTDMWETVLESEKLAKIGVFVETSFAPIFYRKAQIVTNTPSVREELIKVMKFAPHLVDVVPPGIGEQYVPGEHRSPTPLVVAVARLMPTKKVDEMIRIVVEVRKRQPEVELVIVGDGYEREHLEGLVRDLDAADYVHFAGYVTEEEKVRLYQQAWVVASASIAEGWGMTLTEANACGTPVVATRIPGHEDAVADESSGLLGATSAEMVDHIDAIIADGGLRDRLAKGALAHAATLRWDAASRRVFSLLAAQAVARRRR